MFSFQLGFPRSSAANSQSAVLFERMLRVQPALAPYLQNTANLSKAESWMIDVAGIKLPEAYDLDMLVLLKVKGRVDVDRAFVSLTRRSAAWAYAIAEGLAGPDVTDSGDESYYGIGYYGTGPVHRDDARFVSYFNFASIAIAEVGGDLDAGGTSGFWKGFFTDAFVRRLEAVVEACPSDVSPIVFCEDMNSYGLDGATALHRDGVPREYIQAYAA